MGSNFAANLSMLYYEGFIGLEYRPLGETDPSLSWLAEYSPKIVTSQ